MELTTVEREALQLASVDCVGHYNLPHLEAWKRLERAGLVEHITEDAGLASFYRTTDAGQALLRGEV